MSTGPQCLVDRSGAHGAPSPTLSAPRSARLPDNKCRIADTQQSILDSGVSHMRSVRCLHDECNRPFTLLTQATRGDKCKGPDCAVGCTVGPTHMRNMQAPMRSHLLVGAGTGPLHHCGPES